MDKFTTHTGTAVPLRRSNVDTDQIIPAVYLKRVTRDGFEDGLFAAWRGDESFVLNRPEYADGSVLVAGARRLGAARLGFPGSHRSPIR
jgi:3-isopropylmalate/(R)-2-methylmalate dehydratase small subunit